MKWHQNVRNYCIIFANITGKNGGITSSSLPVITASLFIALLKIFKIAYLESPHYFHQNFNFVFNWKHSKFDKVYNELLLMDVRYDRTNLTGWSMGETRWIIRSVGRQIKMKNFANIVFRLLICSTWILFWCCIDAYGLRFHVPIFVI